ncbi:hypothetical protein BITS_0912 [Bifidobacterium tsurumiense]|uniref:Uncharacterized protein n=1 Tax=Bifidobacterium tsurumiense TaxID=356829 RepID=A0A087EKU3_9BIFI|nr:hypothetical protein BITS_0912 [Bifidobacterium tsurumiense]
MNSLHLHFDILQTASAIQKRLGMLDQPVVGQVCFVSQSMFQARPVIHGDSAELHFHRGVMSSGRKEHGHSINNVKAAVSVLLRIFDVILYSKHLDV